MCRTFAILGLGFRQGYCWVGNGAHSPSICMMARFKANSAINNQMQSVHTFNVMLIKIPR